MRMMNQILRNKDSWNGRRFTTRNVAFHTRIIRTHVLARARARASGEKGQRNASNGEIGQGRGEASLNLLILAHNRVIEKRSQPERNIIPGQRSITITGIETRESVQSESPPGCIERTSVTRSLTRHRLSAAVPSRFVLYFFLSPAYGFLTHRHALSGDPISRARDSEKR